VCVGWFSLGKGKGRLAGLGPIQPGEFPDPTTWFPDLPDKGEIEQYEPPYAPTQVTLEYVNHSGENLRLILFDCSRYYASGKASWMDMPFDGDGSNNHFNGFLFGKGWYLIAVRDSRGAFHYLGESKMFDVPLTRVEVVNANGKLVWKR
jgi:hypothetical protein